MCACSFCPTCPAIREHDTVHNDCRRCCRYTCPMPPKYCQPCPPPCPCTPWLPCKCCPVVRPRPAQTLPDYVGPQVPELPVCKPRRLPPSESEPPPPQPSPVFCPPCLPWCSPPEPCEVPTVQPCPNPIECYKPVLPCCNPQCPPPIIPKQRPICPRAPPACYPCLPVSRTSCPHCELDPVTRRRPLIVHNGVEARRPLPPVEQSPPSGCYYHVPVPLW